MIPLNTPPGTEIVCVDDSPHSKTNAPWLNIVGDLNGLKSGVVYTVRDWSRHLDGKTMDVRLNEIVRPIIRADGIETGYHPSRFRLLEVHPSLTALLDAKPIFHLDEEAFDEFAAALDNPPAPNEKLKALMRR